MEHLFLGRTLRAICPATMIPAVSNEIKSEKKLVLD